MPDRDPDDQRISRRSLLRLQLARWVDPTPTAAPAQPAPRVPEPVAEALVELADVEAGMQVLDFGTGELSRTVPRGADVTACPDDPRDLPFVDGAFDVVLCAFGSTPAASAARELVRVTCPGGVVALALGGSEDAARARLSGLLEELETRTVGDDGRHLLIRGRRAIPRA